MLHKNICCNPSSEPSHQDGSDEGSHHMVSMRNKKNCHQILCFMYISAYYVESILHIMSDVQ